MNTTESKRFIVIGAGVIGLSTALTLSQAYPGAQILIVAKYFPGDYHIDYTSPWAGGNWCSSANDNGLLESFDRVTFKRFQRLAEDHPECGISKSALRMIFDQTPEQAEILSRDTGKLWYERLVGGVEYINKDQLPDKAVFGLNVNSTFVINTQVYLQWLLARCRDQKVQLIRRQITHIDELFKLFPMANAVFNCTGLGSYSLGGVEDKMLYPTRGQIVLVEQPIEPLKRMYFRSPRRVDNDTTYIFQRPLGGGIVLGGCREDGNWNGDVDMAFAKDIMKRCCALAPELGKPENLKVIRHGVGLRPSRRGGPRIEAEMRQNGGLVIHNYGASGAGYQASWGMAEHGVAMAQSYLVSDKTLSPKL